MILLQASEAEQLTLDDRSFTKVRIGDIHKILLKLQDDEKIVKITDVLLPVESADPTRLREGDFSENAETITIEADKAFGVWYQKFSNIGKTNQTPNTSAPKYTRKALEKIWNLLQEIEEKRQLTAENKKIKLPFMPPGFKGTRLAFDLVFPDRQAIVHKLELRGAISELSHTEGLGGFWSFKPGKNYRRVFDFYDAKYQKAAKEYEQNKGMEEIKIKEPVYEVQYSEVTREILINGFLVAKPDFERENERFFTYVFNKPNKRISKKEIEDYYKEKLTKTFHKIAENLGFTGNFKKAFFDISSKGIRFRNPVTKKDLDSLGIKYLTLKGDTPK